MSCIKNLRPGLFLLTAVLLFISRGSAQNLVTVTEQKLASGSVYSYSTQAFNFGNRKMGDLNLKILKIYGEYFLSVVHSRHSDPEKDLKQCYYRFTTDLKIEFSDQTSLVFGLINTDCQNPAQLLFRFWPNSLKGEDCMKIQEKYLHAMMAKQWSSLSIENKDVIVRVNRTELSKENKTTDSAIFSKLIEAIENHYPVN